MQVTSEAILLVAIDYEIGNVLLEELLEAIALFPNRLLIRCHLLLSQAAGFAQPHDAGGVVGARSPAPLVPATIEQWLQFIAPLHDECAHTFGTVEFVGGEGEQGDAPVMAVDGEFADGLGGVAEEGDLVVAGDRPNFLDGVDGADFVVGCHDAEEVDAAGAGLL